jgi:hypothetical protein
MKKIKFQTVSAEIDIPKPIPASKMVPKWYRTMDGVQELILSVKKCVPFLDAFTSGYVITLPVDVTWDKEQQEFRVPHTNLNIVSKHHDSQINGLEVPPGFSSTPHKWTSQWHIKTPRGYSCLFIHPLNRPELPFYSFTGVVDTDKHPLVVNLPFLLREDFEGVIPAGTPLIQVIPFKREDWVSKVDDSHSYNYPKVYEVEVPPFAWYKRKWWSRKRYS